VVIHLSSHRGLIVRANKALEDIPELNSKVFNKRMELIGRIFDIFGPVDQPYISIKMSGDFGGMRLLDLKGEAIYSNKR
jgi:RNA-binding protein